MARYVMANRRAGKFQAAEKSASREAMEVGFDSLFRSSVEVVHDRNPRDPLARRVLVFDADPEEVSAKAPALSSDVLVEPEILHFPVAQVLSTLRRGGPPIVGLRAPNALAFSAAPPLAFTARITGSGAGLFGTEVTLFLTDASNQTTRMTAETDTSGFATFNHPADLSPFAMVIAPAGGHWSLVVRNVVSGMAVDCPAFDAVGAIDWWHEQVGVTQFDAARGTGIKVGVIDTGCGPHGGLSHVTLVGAFINGGHDPDGTADVDSHGSHVCGTIGARPVDAFERGGIAPGVSLFCARVFPANGGANQGDIVNAIDVLSRDHRVDLVNMSLGADQGSEIERDAIRDALQRGTLCVCAAGNSGGSVGFPAAFDESVAVSASGLADTAPPGTISASRVPTDPNRIGTANRFLASFSSFGPEVDCAAPGVGIIATVPERFGLARPYGVMDGTSMASPVACGTLAALLADSPSYQALTGSARAEEARRILGASCQSLGLSAVFQGKGVPRIP
jgi:subtilisin